MTVFLHFRYLLRRVLLPLWYPQKKKRMTIAYELQMLRLLNVGNGRTRCYFPGGVPLVDRDELKTEVMVSGRFLRSVVFLCMVIRLS